MAGEDYEMDEEFNLKELIDPKHPMMTMLRERAKGTWKHSQNTANFAEAVALELDLEVDPIKVGAFYHDIGKVNFPEAFSENQNGKNLHEEMEPIESYTIITKHVGDSVLYMLQIPEMPKYIIEWVSQHHGDTVLRYFFEKSESKKETRYRYRCPKPMTIEAAILMICDCIEATARSYASNDKLKDMEGIEKLVFDSIGRLEMDGQLDNVLTGHLRRIKEVLIKELAAMYHKRELYPDENDIDEV